MKVDRMAPLRAMGRGRLVAYVATVGAASGFLAWVIVYKRRAGRAG